ncbi:MAG TPA: bifunctional proline dehydrogenase/L-glutamate gamma-semialdehyde dehydrogenase PutA [Dongiaceae bacterium]|jgi:RHH-type proline utilization regulon transcriptional repressor/proline dehydrogenase/delta 1-pyrroline-5-carboxylate dehydrogenase|nr:bifunctional proline dehydrogenase/L-glutamate gamma-semialdehyde dehydrogenase PutA [Dongiaceae bacterium]
MRLDLLRRRVREALRPDENKLADTLIEAARFSPEVRERIDARARAMVQAVREASDQQSGIDAFLGTYELSSKEGVVLMCLAEALLRIPDAETANRLIKDKLRDANFAAHVGASDSLFVNASTWALMLTGRFLKMDREAGDLGGTLKRLISRSGEPFIRQAVTQAMKILGRQFVMGRTIAEAMERARTQEARGYRYSYDMLGEGARTGADAERYFAAYADAIAAIGAAGTGEGPRERPGISIKLSALHPRYEMAQAERVMGELAPKLVALAQDAKRVGIALTVDAEEADRLDLSLDIIEAVLADPSLGAWEGFGLAIQSYQKRCLPLIDWLAEAARHYKRRLMIRLVKGAYWDSEIKWTQERGLADYPVFTRKVGTDVSYLACARKLLAAGDHLYPMFATHNAHTLAAVIELAGGERRAAERLEFQRLHGMGKALYEQIVPAERAGIPCRIYAPVGSHEDLLAYLVRRLLENGANTSFVNRIQDEQAPLDDIVADPVSAWAAAMPKRHPAIPLPADLYGSARRNSRGTDLNDPLTLVGLLPALEKSMAQGAEAAPVIGGIAQPGEARTLANPADRRKIIGEVREADGAQVDQAMEQAQRAWPEWTRSAERPALLERAADLLEQNRDRLMALCMAEAGKTLPDAVAELREAVDFCRYYAQQARNDFAAPRAMPGPTGERNELALMGRGVFACISPWNFPLAIFLGQVSAALAAGNCVIAKPAEQTPLIATLAVRLLHEAGIPKNVLHLLPGDGAKIGARLIAHPLLAGVAFTGSTETARLIHRALAAKDGPIVPLIAETGGQNAMIVDSSALPEQVVRDVLSSSFQSAGQRCSALRVLFVQEDIAPKLLGMLTGAMEELVIGDPFRLSTDVGPVIDSDAHDMLLRHAERMRREGTILCERQPGPDCAHGTFFGPLAVDIDNLARLPQEIFGPILHVIRYSGQRLDAVLAQIRATGYGLTLGIHSRIESTVEEVLAAVPVGNAYVNRNMIGAVVGVQPFGGMGLSGTGPKAGGPYYLHRFATERTVSIDTTAAGGNASLLSLADALRGTNA